MKKVLVMSFAVASLAACNNGAETTEEAKVDSQATTSTTVTSENTSYTAQDGDVKYTGNKVMVMKNGAWVEADQDVKLDNGVVVYRNGRAERNDTEIELREGEIVNKTGDFIDNTGQAVSNAWEVTKEGAKDAGRAVKKTAKKIGQKVENAIDGDTTRR
jgi:hypothetical protein